LLGSLTMGQMLCLTMIVCAGLLAVLLPKQNEVPAESDRAAHKRG
jgi:hypothetical protein